MSNFFASFTILFMYKSNKTPVIPFGAWHFPKKLPKMVVRNQLLICRVFVENF